ncbi:uncharacterized protein LOC124258241 [Haliotis rubra]|uniref:uncharacterized protein LOC124258241 n=1 Tax=Haliotis rubra TaxID=36100 RepID=UPI001EE5C81F|nr:uncharacterized protein LOC124258241 [Haliotis rubra]
MTVWLSGVVLSQDTTDNFDLELRDFSKESFLQVDEALLRRRRDTGETVGSGGIAMGKTRAEIQKAYRERLKAKNNEAYLAKERKRRSDSYVPSAQLSRKDRLRRNLRNKETLKRHRQRKRAIAQADDDRAPAHDIDTSGYDSLPDGSQAPLLVQMRFPNRRNGPRKRISHALAAKTSQVSKLKDDLQNLKRKYKTVLLKLQRKGNRGPSPPSPQTPRRQTAAQIRRMGLTKDQGRRVKRQLLLGNVLMKELATARSSIRSSKRRVVHNIVAGKIVKRYRCINMLSQKTGLSRNKLGKVKSKTIDPVRQRRFREVMRFREDVLQFMNRDDNSRNLPGKGDKISTGTGEYVQKRILTDYLTNLHQKFLAEHPVKLSLASFCRIRPKQILTTAFITRDCCLCTRHQNMALILKSLKPLYPEIPLNPEKYSENPRIDDMKANLLHPEFTYGQWKRVPVEIKGKTKVVMKIVQVTESKSVFFETLKLQTLEFIDHVSRLKTQYSQIRELKQNLPRHEAIIHMDFAENYNCKSVEEIQSAYWNQTSVTLHPVVVYTLPVDGSDLQHQSFVLVPDEMNHNSTTVLTFLKYIIQEVKQLDPELKHVHYWTDSPTSQYRNKSIFNLVANHEDVFNITATWNYFEAGHGKGPCDGLGGTVKRMADQAVNAGKVVIQDSKDFFAWSQSQHCSMPNVNFLFVSTEECEATAASQANRKLKPVKGTMKIHAVKGRGSGHIHVRDTSCYCNRCLGGTVCDTWQEETTVNQDQEDHSVLTETDMSGVTSAVVNMSDDTGVAARPNYNVGEFVAALYSGRWYIGKVETVDPEDSEYEINFMESKKSNFQWPAHEDVIWCKESDVICHINTPVPSGKSKRMYTITKSDRLTIESHMK